MTLGCVAKPRLVKRRWWRKAALHNHTVPFSSGTVANSTIDIKPLSPPMDLLAGDRTRKTPYQLPIYLSIEEKVIIISKSTRYGIGQQRAG
jgi:hypothetical protein